MGNNSLDARKHDGGDKISKAFQKHTCYGIDYQKIWEKSRRRRGRVEKNYEDFASDAGTKKAACFAEYAEVSRGLR